MGSCGMCESTTTPGMIVVCDNGNNRIQELSLDGGGAPHVLVQFTEDICPFDITPCGDGTTDYIITDTANNRVLRISGVNGSIIWTAGSRAGSGPHQLNSPSDVKMLLDGRAAVTDCGNNRIQVLDAATGTFLQQMG